MPEIASFWSRPGRSTKNTPSKRSARANSGGSLLASLQVPTKKTSLSWSCSPKVAAEHYLMSREHHFKDVVGGSKDSDGGAGQGSPGGSDANCDASCDSAGHRTGQHTAARNDRTRCHHSGCSGFFEDDADFRNRPSGQHRIRTCDLYGVKPAYRSSTSREKVHPVRAKPTNVIIRKTLATCTCCRCRPVYRVGKGWGSFTATAPP